MFYILAIIAITYFPLSIAIYLALNLQANNYYRLWRHTSSFNRTLCESNGELKRVLGRHIGGYIEKVVRGELEERGMPYIDFYIARKSHGNAYYTEITFEENIKIVLNERDLPRSISDTVDEFIARRLTNYDVA